MELWDLYFRLALLVLKMDQLYRKLERLHN